MSRVVGIPSSEDYGHQGMESPLHVIRCGFRQVEITSSGDPVRLGFRPVGIPSSGDSVQ